MKRCGTCGETKPFINFYRLKASKDGHGYRCRPCDTAARKKYLEKNRESERRSARGRNLRHKYGIGIKEYEAMLEKQGGACACCGSTNPRAPYKSGSFCVDHDHDTGTIRGLLCVPCNRGIGLLGDNAASVEQAVTYLRRAT